MRLVQEGNKRLCCVAKAAPSVIQQTQGPLGRFFRQVHELRANEQQGLRVMDHGGETAVLTPHQIHPLIDLLVLDKETHLGLVKSATRSSRWRVEFENDSVLVAQRVGPDRSRPVDEEPATESIQISAAAEQESTNS